ncbi:uncharacterized protein LOC100366899 [Saccoglossus kowalevskii]|uniref:Uncharacterized protein LOC100366899 n=1 Tax=Saccoglossus kowalevskii TaxID=10224 RepID=A0ABM0M1L7_SACKO|nr:PREDICTED: uncharacterized protein LOC100366899 [Saccoglossus kowalevskii]
MTSWVVIRMQELQEETIQFRRSLEELSTGCCTREGVLVIDNDISQSELINDTVLFYNSSYDDGEAPVMKSNNSTNGISSDEEMNILDGPGTLYTRWGRKTCPLSAELVYDGVMGGAYYSHTGGGANYQCLTLNPKWDEPMSGYEDYSGKMYGTEFETIHFNPLSHLQDYEAVCAVCLVNSRSRVLMIPGTNECPSEEWTREYYGYLMTQRYELERTEFICVDRNAEARYASEDNDQGALLHPVEGICGSLPCGPYIDGYELTCVVCTI